MKKVLISFIIFILLGFFCYSNVFSSSIDLTSNDSTSSNLIEQNIKNNTTQNTYSNRSQPVVTEINQSKRDELLSITNIINIILIVIGIVLILLGIAILIKCK